MSSRLELDFNCPVCLEIFKNPVVLLCSHSFCKACLQNWWAEKVIKECPVCKRRSSRSDPPCNLVLKNLCEAFSQDLSLREASEQPEALCPQHMEKLKLFCLDHQQPVCLVCRDSRAHYNHRFRPVDEAAPDYKDQLRKSLKLLQDRLEKCREGKVHWEWTTEHIKQQGQHTERLIQKEFDKMRAFLQNEEQARIRALRIEVEQKRSLMEQRVAALSQELAALSETIKHTEKELRAQDVPFLQNYTVAVKQVQQIPLRGLPEFPSGSLVDVAKHLGNLGFNIWNKMKELVSYTPVVLDPNTAIHSLVLSDDLCSVHCMEIDAAAAQLPWLPFNPERFSHYLTVLGSEGFTSGTHSWEVDVHNEGRWAVGVITQSAPRKREISSGYWEIWFRDGQYTAYAPSQVDKVLTLRQPPNRIRVDLDWKRGKVSFSDSQTDAHIYTFSDVFSEKVFPFVNVSTARHVKLSPMNITVQLQKS